MATYPAGTDVTILVPFQDAAGNVLQPTAAAYSVIDELETVVVAPTALPVAAGAGSVAITIPASANALRPPVGAYPDGGAVGTPVVSSTGMREIDIVFVTATGSVGITVRYLIGVSRRLYVMQNSFQPLNQALLTANDMPNLDGWTLPAVTENQRVAAMIEAYARLTRLGYYVRWPVDPDAQRYVSWGTTQNSVISPRLWTVMSVDRWSTLYPEAFRAALRKAQIVEADQILAGDPVKQKRESGIISEKVGEASMQFRSRKPLDLGVSPEALAYLTGYVDFRMGVARG